jgi:hypothetical protein
VSGAFEFFISIMIVLPMGFLLWSITLGLLLGAADKAKKIEEAK